MLAATRTALALAAGLSLMGCLVSFADYPLAGTSGGASSSGASGSDTGGATTGGSDTGNSGTNGLAGTGSPPSGLMIDDFEDGDSQVLLVAGRNGKWFAENDGSGQQSPNPHGDALPSLLNPPNGESTRALHTSGSGFTGWGALVGANFVLSGMTAEQYDISAYSGLSFSAKLGKSTAVKQLRVSIQNYDTAFGCTTCGDNFGTSASLADTFQTISVPFSSLKQQGWGRPQVTTFDTKRTYSMTFAWLPHETFDVWIDDVSFY